MVISSYCMLHIIRNSDYVQNISEKLNATHFYYIKHHENTVLFDPCLSRPGIACAGKFYNLNYISAKLIKCKEWLHGNRINRNTHVLIIGSKNFLVDRHQVTDITDNVDERN